MSDATVIVEREGVFPRYSRAVSNDEGTILSGNGKSKVVMSSLTKPYCNYKYMHA